MLSRLRSSYQNYPNTFWTLMGASFVDQLGRFLLLPFFALYITERFAVSMTEVGYLFALFSGFSIIGTFLGGALTDRFGRRAMLLFGLVVSGLSSLLMGLAGSMQLFYVLAAFLGLLSNAAGPAQEAMIADLIPEDKRPDAYSVHRVVFNAAAILGPLLGSLLVTRSYFLLFATDALSSIITAIFVYRLIPETMPADPNEAVEQTLLHTLRGYQRSLRDNAFTLFVLISIFVTLIFTQISSTLPVYLRDVHSIPPQGYASLISLNALLVVFLQLWVTRRVSPLPPLLVMALGSVLYGLGFGLFAFGSTLAFFALAAVVLTFGEMVSTPVAQSLVAAFAPSDMRGRYFAVFGLSWNLAYTIGPLLGGALMDRADPRFVWYACLAIGLLGAAAYLLLRPLATRRLSPNEASTN